MSKSSNPSCFIPTSMETKHYDGITLLYNRSEKPVAVLSLQLIVGVFYLAFHVYISKAEKTPTIIAIVENSNNEEE